MVSLPSPTGSGDVEQSDLLLDIPLARPGVSDPGAVAEHVEKILASGVLTNGPYVRQLEDAAAEYLGVGHCVAVSSCTAGLMLLLRVSELTGDVVVPSFSFAATAHAVDWNGLRPVFADIDPQTLTLDPDAVSRAVGVRTSAILATHVYGTPCDVEGLADVADRAGVKLFFDAAHAFGSLHGDRNCGTFGDAEVFSLSPTKVLIAGEGGIVSTNDAALAERLRIGRDYGNPGDYDCLFPGLNARMSEVHAAIALDSFTTLEKRVARRNELAGVYRRELASVPGIVFPTVPKGDRSTFKDLTILVEADTFGMDADALASGLDALGIETRRYYSPPIHRMHAYRSLSFLTGDLPVTNRVSASALSLPLWEEMSDHDPARVAAAVRRIREYVTTGRRSFAQHGRTGGSSGDQG
jgi:dTDP-4-amino-4,6-dideoxygalactose transaminase